MIELLLISGAIIFLFILIGVINKPYIENNPPTLPDWKFNICKMRDWRISEDEK